MWFSLVGGIELVGSSVKICSSMRLEQILTNANANLSRERNDAHRVRPANRRRTPVSELWRTCKLEGGVKEREGRVKVVTSLKARVKCKCVSSALVSERFKHHQSCNASPMQVSVVGQKFSRTQTQPITKRCAINSGAFSSHTTFPFLRAQFVKRHYSFAFNKSFCSMLKRASAEANFREPLPQAKSVRLIRAHGEALSSD